MLGDNTPAVPSATSALQAVGWGVAFSVVTLMLLSLGIESALHFAGPPIDGPFQLYNALRRIAAGQRGGVDFQFFHGIGIPYLHYVPFRLMGSSFTASELSRQIITTLSGPLLLLAFFRVFTSEWRRALALSTIVLSITVALGLWPILLAVNSLLGLRSTFASVVPIIWVLPVRPRLRAVLTGVALGASILLGTEQGLAVLIAFAVVNVVLIARSTEWRARLLESATVVGVGVLTIVLVVTGVGGVAGLKGAMYYNLTLVPMDQYWYFGSPPNAFITGWNDIWPLMIDQPRIPLAMLIGLAAFAVLLRRTWREPRGETGRRHAALAILALYGLISCASLLGIFLVSYVLPGIRGLLMIGGLELDRALTSQRLRVESRGKRSFASLELVGIVSLLAMAVSVPSMIRTFAVTLPHVVSAHVIRHEGMRLEGIWPMALTSGQQILDDHRGADGAPPKLWSTYAGLLEARNGLFHPSTDYIIHVLGPQNRVRYVADFRAVRPALVQTVVPTYSLYETWIEQTSWDFYAELINNYRVIGGTPWSIFWERLPAATAPPRPFWSSTLTRGSQTVDIPMPAPAATRPEAMLVQIEVTYRIRNPLGVLPVVGSLPRYLVVPSGAITRPPVTLNPYTTTARFPIVASEGARVRLDFKTYSLLPGARIDVSLVRASQIRLTPGFFPWLYDFATAGARPPAVIR